MSTFRYRAKDQTGRMIAGKVEAPTAALAEQALDERNLQIVLLAEERKRFRIPISGRVRARDIVIFSRQLSTLIGANVTLIRSLRVLVEQTQNQTLKQALQEIADNVEGGMLFSLALSKHERIFNNFFINMVKSGETAGRLAEVLNYLADQTEKDYDLISKLRGAMMYPAFIVFGMIVVGIVLLIFVIPQLTAVLQESGAKLPLTTRGLIAVSGFTKGYWWALALLAVGFAAAFKFGLKKREFRERVDTFKLRVPILGPLLQKIYLARATRSLQILLSGGVDVVDALDVVSEAVGNSYYSRVIRDTKREVADGNPINTVFNQSNLVPRMVSQMLAVGEESGQLIPVLEKLTAFYTREIDNGVTALVSIIEPLIMVIIGLGVGLVVASIILPMYQLAGQY